jgi:hypothetical protein
VELRSPGVWKIVVTAVDGRVSRTVRGSREDAEEELLLLLVGTIGGDRRFGVIVEAHLLLLGRGGRSAGTLRRYREVWDRWLSPRLAGLPVSEINGPLLQSVVDAMAVSGQSAGSVNQALSLLSGALGFAVRVGHIDDNPIAYVVLPGGRSRGHPRQTGSRGV